MSTKRNKSVIGQSFMFPPEVIDDIHIKAELGFPFSKKSRAGMI